MFVCLLARSPIRFLAYLFVCSPTRLFRPARSGFAQFHNINLPKMAVYPKLGGAQDKRQPLLLETKEASSLARLHAPLGSALPLPALKFLPKRGSFNRLLLALARTGSSDLCVHSLDYLEATRFLSTRRLGIGGANLIEFRIGLVTGKWPVLGKQLSTSGSLGHLKAPTQRHRSPSRDKEEDEERGAALQN